MTSAWERITDGGGRERTVYWRRDRDPESGCRLTVSAYPKWTWKVWASPRAEKPVASGLAGSVVAGRRAAEQAEREYVSGR